MSDIRDQWLEYINEQEQKYTTTRAFQKIIDWFDITDFWTAPASTKYHAAFEGGLAYHSLKMAKILANLTKMHNIEWASAYSPLIVAMLHDVCKIGVYTRAAQSRRARLPSGEFAEGPYGKPVWEQHYTYTFDDSACPMGHGAKSVILAQRHIRLTPQEELCILWHMGVETADKFEPSGFSAACQNDVAVLWTHVADRLAAIEEINEVKAAMV